MPDGSNKQDQNKYIGKKKILGRAEFEKAQISEFKNEPLEVSRMPLGKEELTEKQPSPSATSEEEKPQSVEDFKPKMDEPPKESQGSQENQNNDDVSDKEYDDYFDQQSARMQGKENQPSEEKGAEAQEPTQQEGVRKKLTDRAKEFYIQKKKALFEGIKKRFSKAGAQAAGKAIWAFVVAFWPYILAAIVIIFILIMISSGCSKQSGKTPYQSLSKTQDKKLVLKTMAVAGDKASQRQLIIDESAIAKINVQKLPTSNAEAKKKTDQINQLLNETITLSDNETAINERINQILALLDQLKTILADQASLIDEIKAQILSIRQMLVLYQNTRLILNPKDMDYLRNFDIDKRTVQMLLYLVTPTDQGGAGHERIRVKRIKFSYDTENKSVSKETDYSDQDEPNISAHYTGQAADISEVDCIKCTQIKRRRIGRSNKSAQPPTPIKLAWQSEEGYAKAGGPEAYGANMHQVFNNLASGATSDMLITEVSDILGIDLDPEKIKGRTLPEISRYIGNAVVKETFDIPGDYELGNNLGEVAGSVGRAYLAQAMNVPFEGIQGSNIDEIEENVGRATIEKTMVLPAGSLAGNSSNEIFSSVGRRFLEDSLNLSRDSLATPFNDANSFKRVIGQGKTESSLDIQAHSFYGSSINEAKTRMGQEAFETTFANPETIDNWLGLSTGTTEKLINGQLSPDSYNQAVGDKVYNDQFAIYQNDGKRAEVFGVNTDDLNALIAGNQTVFVSIGKTAIANTTTVTDEEKGMLRQWFDGGAKSPELDDDYIGGKYALEEGDFDKIFTGNLSRQVFQRIGQTEILSNLSNNPKIGAYAQDVQAFVFYTDRLHLIKDNFEYMEKNSPNPEIKAKAGQTKNLINDMLNLVSITDIQKNTKQIQENIKFIEEKGAESDPESARKIKSSKKAVNEIITGKEIEDFDTLSADSITAKTDPQTKLTKKDILGLLTGKKTIDDLIYPIGLRKWEIELDLPDNSLNDAYNELKKTDYKNPDTTMLISIGKTRLKEYGSLFGQESQQIDSDLGLPQGTTEGYRDGKITENAYHEKIGMGVTNNVASKLLNRQLNLTNSPYYSLTGSDVSKMLNGGWFVVALKVGGQSVDQALGFPEGGTLDIVQQTNRPGDALAMLAEKKLGIIAGLDRAVSLSGDIPYNLGRVKIEQELGLKANEINDSNLVAKIKEYTNSNADQLSQLDMAFGLQPWTSMSIVEGGGNSHEYIVDTGNYVKNNVFYGQIEKYAPSLKNKDVKNIVMSLAEQTGTPQDILSESAAGQIGDILGLNYPVSIRGNFKDNLGQGKVEDRLGLLHGSFEDNIDIAIGLNGQEKFASAFYIDRDELDNARKSNSGYWNTDRENQAKLVDAILNIPSGNTKDFLTGSISLAAYVDKVGQNSLKEVAVDKLADLTGLEDKYQTAAQTLIDVFNEDPTFSNAQSQQKLYEALMGVGGWDLDNKTKFDPGTWQKLLIQDPTDPEHTGLKNADVTLLEQGKKWLPRWLGMDEKYDSAMDAIYELGAKQWGPLGVYNEEVFTTAVQDITGIPDENDARRFVTGDIKGGLTSWGAAQIVKAYNNEFGDQATEGFALDYATAKKAYFNDVQGETIIGDAAVAKAREEVGGAPIDATAEATIRQEAIRDSRDNSRKNLQYRTVDIQLHKADKNIPAGFTQAMREGTADQKWQMGLNYIGNKVHSQNADIPADLLPNLQQYFDPNSPNFHNSEALSGSTLSFLDDKMTNWFGDFVQPGTAKALMEYGKTGKLGSPTDQGSITQIYADYGASIVTNWADKQSGLPSGTTKLVYDYYTKYQVATATYQKAQAAYGAAKLAGDAAKTAEAAKQIQSSQAAVNGLKAEAISTVITFAFQKQLLATDQKLGLVPGSSSMLVGMGVQMWLTGAISPWTIGLFVVTNLFGVYRVDVTCTACGYYPEMTAASTTQSCPLGEFDGKSADEFKTNALAAAQWKTNQLVNDLLQMPKALNDENLVPTQIMTYNQTDVDSFGNTLNDLYGSSGARGNSGLWANELMWDHVHVGF